MKDFPINNIKKRLEEGNPVTASDLRPFCEAAKASVKECYALADHCPWHGIFEPSRCTRPTCRMCSA